MQGNVGRITRFIPLFFAAALALSHLAAAEAPKSEAKPLFDGKSLDGWDGDATFWSVEDGLITGRSTADKPVKQNTFLIWKGGKPADFELRVMYRIEGGNSGIQYRSKAHADHVVSGYQADIVGGEPDKYSGILYEEKGRGIIAQRGQKVVIGEEGKKRVAGSVGESAEILKAIKPGDWNEYVIIAKGNHLTQKINGVTTVEVTDNETAKAARDGVIALQIHTGPPMTVQFKEITLKESKE